MNLQIQGLALPNGMPLVIVEDPTASEIDVTMRYRVGSVDDPADHPGMAHLVEHLMFQQTLGSRSLFAHLEDATTYFNGETTFDATTYVARAPASKLDELLSIEAVRVGFRCTTINDAAFEREREVVANEVLETDAGSELRTALDAAIYPEGHPYRRPIRGTVDSVRAITREQACAFADAHYGPANGALVISGNVTPDVVIASLKKFLARVGKHDVVAQVPVATRGNAPRRVEASAPIDGPAVMLAWPLPDDPKERAEVEAIASIAKDSIDANVSGRVNQTVLGGERAPMYAVIVEVGNNERAEDVIKAAANALDEVAGSLARTKVQVFGELSFDVMQQTAIYDQYAALEDAARRNARFAASVLAGHDPEQQLAGSFAGLRSLTPDEAARVAREYLTIDRATVAILKPEGKKTGHTISVAAAIHDLGQRRDPADPADAHKPLTTAISPASAVRSRTLPNGMRVVLLPVTSVPTVDIRLVFGAGTGDEPAAKRGVALVAAHALTWNLDYINDLIGFAAAGGSGAIDVEPDVTAFSVRGVDMHMDLLLAGLRRWVRDGVYDENSETVLDVLRAQAKRIEDAGALTDAWREALYGTGHPYAAAGLVRYISHSVSIADAERFRAAHYTPDNATLVIAGHFDAALADQWIDFLFADWHGTAEQRLTRHATPSPASLGAIEDTAQAQIEFSLPATAGTRAAQLVAAAMLDQIANDVRHQLGASYGVNAALDDERLAAEYVIGGSVIATRTADAMQLLHDRIAQLHSDPAAAASLFVTARQHVLAHLAAVEETSSGLAAQVEHELSIGGDERTDRQTADAVRALTIDTLGPTLADLDLAKAAVLIRGPEEDVQKGFAALGRTPRIIALAKDLHDHEDAPEPIEHHARSQRDIRIAAALTDQLAGPALTITAGIGYAATQVIEPSELVTYDCCTGPMFVLELGYRYESRHAVGLHLGVGSFSGNEMDGFAQIPMTLHSVDIDAFVQATAYDRLWGAAFVGAHIDDLSIMGGVEGTTAGVGIGIEGGVDVVRVSDHRIGGFFRVDGTLMSDSGYGAITLGLAYRR
jgi:zinc protease